MLKNYLKITYRNLIKSKAFSLINILGLVIGMVAAYLIILYVSFETSYDRFQEEGENIYRIRADYYYNGQLESESAFTVPALGPTLKMEIPEVRDYFRLTSWAENYTVILQDQQETITFKEESAVFADASFIPYFSLQFLTVASDSLLTQPNRVIISETTAEKYFGTHWQTENNPVGALFLVYSSNRDEKVSFMIEGVYEDMPQNSHLQYHLIFSHKTLPYFLPKEIPEAERFSLFETAWGPSAWYTYLVLEDQAEPQAVAQKITDFVESRNQVKEAKEIFTLQPISDIHLHSHLMNEPGVNGNARWVYTMAAIAILILCIAWINYINLSTARALDRAREVSLRKVVGARRSQLIRQFLLEAAIINITALMLALTIAQIVAPYFSDLTGIAINFFSENTRQKWILMGIMWLTGTLLTGFYPAFVLSSFQPATMLKGTLFSASKGLYLRKALVVIQFAASLSLIIGTLIIYKQTHFMKNQDLGIQIRQTLVIEGPNVLEQEISFEQTVENLRNAIAENPSIKVVSATSAVPGSFGGLTRGMQRMGNEEAGTKELKEVLTDGHYLPALGVTLLAGRYFAENPEQNHHKVILNEAAINAFGYSSAEEAIHAKLGMQTYGGLTEYEIIGVVQNFHQSSLQYAYEPMGFFYEIYSGDYIIQITPSPYPTHNLRSTISFIEEQWKKVFPNNPFNYYFLDDFFNQQYQAEQRFGKIFSLFSMLTIFIACLGLFGLTSFNVVQRTKEIGIRKVLGAPIHSIVALLSKGFIKLVFIANLMALPLSYLIMQQWLANYAFRIEISWWFLLLPVTLVILIALFTVSFQTIKAALANPIESLRYE